MDEYRPESALMPSAAGTPPPLAWSQQRPYGSARVYAGFWRRYVATVIDGLVLSAVNYPLTFILDEIPARVVDQDPFADSVWLILSVWFAASLVVFIVLDWFYFAGLESSSWQATLGKRALGIAVTDLQGGRVSFGRATGRYFAHYISIVIFLLGFLIQPFTAKRQTLHDMIAGTLVVRA